LCKISSSIWEDKDFQILKDKNDRLIILFRLSVEIFREFLIRSDYERSVQFVKQFMKNDVMI
jgi:hypothetical protein